MAAGLAAQLASIPPGQLVCVAGVGYREGVAARDADIGWPMGVVRRHDGDLIFADIRGHRLWRIDSDGILHFFLGDGVPGSDDGIGSDARVFSPHDMCLDATAAIYLSQLGARGPDEGPNVIRRVDPATAQIDTVVGSGRQGRAAEGLHAREVEMDTTTGVAVAADGAIHFCGKWDSCVFRVDPQDGMVTRVAGQTTRHYPLEEGARRPYSGAGYSFAGFHGDGGPALECALQFPEHLAFDTASNLLICDNGSHRVRRVDTRSGVISTVFGTGVAASTGDGGPATAASTNGPDALFADVHGNIWVSETRGYRLRRVDAGTGTVTTHAGCGLPGWGGEEEPAVSTRCNHLESGIWADADGSVLYSDSSGRLRQVDPAGVVRTVAGGTSIHDGSPATSAFLGCPTGLCVGGDGTLYVADMVHDRIRAVDPDTGLIRTVAGNGGRGFGGDGGLAADAYLLNPYDVAVDREGRLLISDSLNARVRRVVADGRIETIAGTGEGFDGGDGSPARNASFLGVHAVACAPNGDVYVGDSGGRLRVIEEGGDGRIRTVAGVGIPGWSGDGGPADRARIGTPAAIAFDARGTIYFADLTQHVVRRIDADGVIHTVAGSGQAGHSADGTVATAARLHRPLGIAVGADGTVFVADARNNRVRAITRSGVMETVAGCDAGGDTAGPVAATDARLNEPRGLWLQGDVLLICDHYNNRVKAVRLTDAGR